jgi:hypothetical protein
MFELELNPEFDGFEELSAGELLPKFFLQERTDVFKAE